MNLSDGAAMSKLSAAPGRRKDRSRSFDFFELTIEAGDRRRSNTVHGYAAGANTIDDTSNAYRCKRFLHADVLFAELKK